MSNNLLNTLINATTKCSKHLIKSADNQHNHDHSMMKSVGQHNLHDGMIVNL
jgi:hypothetical protein